METRSPSALAEEWIERWSPTEGSAGGKVEASVLDGELPREQPDLCLDAILEILGRIDTSSPNHLLGVLAAGPLEDLLTYNGDAVVSEGGLLALRAAGDLRGVDPELRRAGVREGLAAILPVLQRHPRGAASRIWSAAGRHQLGRRAFPPDGMSMEPPGRVLR